MLKIAFCLGLLIATAMSSSNTLTNAWIDYIVTVEQPVTLVAFNEVVRRNGQCCSPSNNSTCTVCPDDPNMHFKLHVCFRRGYVRGYNEDDNYCPLGELVDLAPNSAPGAWLHMTARPEARTIPSTYPGSVQLYVKITAVASTGEETHLDYVWVYGQNIPADGTFRRITYLSSQHIAIVGVNTRVECVNGAIPPDCHPPNPPTGPLPTARQETTTMEATTTTTRKPAIHSAPPSTPNHAPIQQPNASCIILTQPSDATTTQMDCKEIQAPKYIGVAIGSSVTTLLVLLLWMLTYCICKCTTRKAQVNGEVMRAQQNHAYVHKGDFVAENTALMGDFVSENHSLTTLPRPPPANHSLLTQQPNQLKEPFYEEITNVCV